MVPPAGRRARHQRVGAGLSIWRRVVDPGFTLLGLAHRHRGPLGGAGRRARAPRARLRAHLGDPRIPELRRVEAQQLGRRRAAWRMPLGAPPQAVIHRFLDGRTPVMLARSPGRWPTREQDSAIPPPRLELGRAAGSPMHQAAPGARRALAGHSAPRFCSAGIRTPRRGWRRARGRPGSTTRRVARSTARPPYVRARLSPRRCCSPCRSWRPPLHRGLQQVVVVACHRLGGGRVSLGLGRAAAFIAATTFPAVAGARCRRCP